MSKLLKHFLNEAPSSDEIREVWNELKNDGARGAAIAIEGRRAKEQAPGQTPCQEEKET
jgi:hypothetical protein